MELRRVSRVELILEPREVSELHDLLEMALLQIEPGSDLEDFGITLADLLAEEGE